MLTGRRLFDGETVSDNLAAVLRKEPEWDAVPDDTPPRIRQLLRRCLERNPKQRLRDIGEARLAIGEVLSGSGEEEELSATGIAPATAPGPRRPWLLPVVALASAAVTFAALSFDRPASKTTPLRKYDSPFRSGTTAGDVSLAPDGSALAYVADGVLHIKELATLEVRDLDAASGITGLAWSPDGEWIAYGAEMGLWKVRRTGGTPIRIATAPSDAGFTSMGSAIWRADGRIFFTTADASLLSVSAQGGQPEEVVPLGENESDFHEMADLGGEGFAFVVHGAEGIDAIDVVGSDGVRKQIAHYPGATLRDVAWSPTGHVLFRRGGDARGIWAIPFSLSTFEAEGAAFLVAPGARSPSAAIDGTLAYVTGSSSREMTLGLLDRKGVVLKTLGEAADYHHWLSVSPDGRQIASMIRDGDTRNLWIIDVERASRRRFTQGPGNHTGGSWDPTGRDFWYHDLHWSSESEFYSIPASGTGERSVTMRGCDPGVSFDGRWLAFNRRDSETGDRDIWLQDLSREDAEPQPFIADPERQFGSTFSPTAPLLAYGTETSGDWEVHLTTYPERRGDWPVSTNGGAWPLWRADGRELFYAVGDSIMSVEIDAGDGASPPRLSRPRFLFRRPRYAPMFPTMFPDGFAVMPNGESFVLHLTTEDETVPPALVVAQNWIQEFQDGE
jgi:serine/threonine-protein kinase